MARNPAKRLVTIVAPAALLAVALALRINEPAPFETMRLTVFDLYQRIAPRPYEPAPVRIVDIDDGSLAIVGQWPWPRSVLAELVDKLNAAGAAAIAFDMAFPEPDRTSPARAGAELARLPGLEDIADRLEDLPDHDELLAEAFGRARVVAGFVLTDEPNERRPLRKWGMATAGEDPRPWLHAYRGAVVNLPAIEATALGNGSFNAVPDSDGVVRRVPLLVRLNDEIVPTLVAEALRVAQGASSYVVASAGASGRQAFGADTGVVAVKIGAPEIPTDPVASVWVHYTGPRRERFVPAWSVLDGTADLGLLTGHIVLIGTSAAGLRDQRASPLDPAGPGVEIHAQALEQILLGRTLTRPDWAPGAEILYTLLLGVGLILLLPRLGPLPCAIIGAAAVAGAIGFSWAGFDRWRLLLDPVVPSLSVLVVYTTATLIGYVRTEAERSGIRNAFGRYLAPALVERLAADPGQLHLGGEVRTMTLMFSDIRDFTAISETLDPEALTRLLNRFFTPMTGIILERRGTIDKYIGDCIMAFWNAPLADRDHALNACRSAVEMTRALARLNDGWRREAEAEGRSHVPIRIGIGLNTADCLVGNMGSDQRFNYSALGEGVNLASRLEGLCKVYGVEITVSETTLQAAGPVAALEIDVVQVKGSTRPLKVFTLLGGEEAAQEDWYTDLAREHGRMMAAYRRQDWAEAEAALARCRDLAPPRLDTLYDLYGRRIAAFAADPPAAAWAGVTVADRK